MSDETVEIEAETQESARAQALEKLGLSELEAMEIVEEKKVRKFLGVGGSSWKVVARRRPVEENLPGGIDEFLRTAEAAEADDYESPAGVVSVEVVADADDGTRGPVAKPEPVDIPDGIVTFESPYRPWADQGPSGTVVPKKGKGFRRRPYLADALAAEEEEAPAGEIDDRAEERVERSDRDDRDDWGHGGGRGHHGHHDRPAPHHRHDEDDFDADADERDGYDEGDDDEGSYDDEPVYAEVEYEDHPDSPVDDGMRDSAVTFIHQILTDMGIGGEVTGYCLADRLMIRVSSDEGALLIGRGGETLDALQYLADIVVNRQREQRVRIVVDAENYRDRKRHKLVDLAKSTAADVVRSGRSVALKPMNPTDRRVIHMTLAEDGRVKTVSEGTGSRRRVVVEPARGGSKGGHGRGGDDRGSRDRGHGRSGGGYKGNGGGRGGRDRGRGGRW